MLEFLGVDVKDSGDFTGRAVALPQRVDAFF
jgi:hypothetical protein